jgi:hypothetical protein
MISSGTTAIATSGAGSVTLLSGSGSFGQLVIINEGSIAGFFSLDSGATWGRIPGAATGSSVTLGFRVTLQDPVVKVKRDGGSDMTGLYAFAI